MSPFGIPPSSVESVFSSHVLGNFAQWGTSADRCHPALSVLQAAPLLASSVQTWNLPSGLGYPGGLWGPLMGRSWTGEFGSFGFLGIGLLGTSFVLEDERCRFPLKQIFLLSR